VIPKQSFLPALALISCLSVPALADYTIAGHPSDFESRVALGATGSTGDYDPSNSITNTSLRVGVAGGANNKVYADAIFFFKLPILQTGETLTNANLRVIELADPANGPPTINADLWALGYTNAASPLNGPAESQAYYYNGPADPGGGIGAGAVRALIQDNFLIPSDVIGTGGPSTAHDTSDSGDVALLSYIQSLYTNPNIIPGTTSVILRLNYDDAAYSPVFATTPNHYTLTAGENANAKPTLSLTTQTVPEPHTLVLFAASALLFSRRARTLSKLNPATAAASRRQ
jgi:hypothetical protein